jgi:acyl-CoA thioesterase
MKNQFDDLEVHKEFYDEIYETLKKEPYAQFLGIELVDLGEGTAIAELEVKEHMLNTHQTVHGAITFAIADYVFAAACNSYGRTAVGLSTTVNFMSAGKPGSRLRASATEEKRNHRLSWYNIQIESDGDLIATMEAVAYRKNDYFVLVGEHAAE